MTWKKQTTKQTNMKSKTESLISALQVLSGDIHTDDGVVNACLEEAAGRLEELQRANQNTLWDLAVAIEQRDEARAEMSRLEKLTRAAAFARDDAFAEVQRVRKLWNESHIAERDDFAKEEARLKAELTESIRERNKTVADLIKQRDEAIAGARQEPSRLEIAAMMLAAMCGSQYTWTNAEGIALRKADTLIALAKETE